MNDQPETNEILRAKLNQETAKIHWMELQRPFAQGAVVRVSPGLDLIDVALAVHGDQKDTINAWAADGQIAKVDDQQARLWVRDAQILWAVVVKPWVLVQEPKS